MYGPQYRRVRVSFWTNLDGRCNGGSAGGVAYHHLVLASGKTGCPSGRNPSRERTLTPDAPGLPLELPRSRFGILGDGPHVQCFYHTVDWTARVSWVDEQRCFPVRLLSCEQCRNRTAVLHADAGNVFRGAGPWRESHHKLNSFYRSIIAENNNCCWKVKISSFFMHKKTSP